ncbi:MAG: serine O-acetyltransferase EpsC [Candidatus Zipacnadales bacterium]
MEEMQDLHPQTGEDTPDDSSTNLPSRQRVIEALHCLQDVLFPGRMSTELPEGNMVDAFIEERLSRAARLLVAEVVCALPFRWKGAYARARGVPSDPVEDLSGEALKLVAAALRELPKIRRLLTKDVQAAYEGDPAAHTYAEIVLSYPSVLAITTHRIAHELYLLDIPLIPRIMSEHAHSHVGIDIHPGARIGERFFIDHGTGVVIGETTIIGNNVKLYQGVTLGAKSFPLDEHGMPVKGIKRHPTLEDDVIVYAGATILGGDTVVGKGSVIGGNVWLDRSVPPYSKVLLKGVDIEITNS